MMLYTYKILLHKEPEGQYTVTVPALSGCVTFVNLGILYSVVTYLPTLFTFEVSLICEGCSFVCLSRIIG